MRYGNLDDDAMEVMAERDRKEGLAMQFETRYNFVSKRDWTSDLSANTVVSDGTTSAGTVFGPRASDRKILKDYLLGYQVEEPHGERWTEITIRSKPGAPDYDTTYYVMFHSDRRTVTVTDQIPYGEYREDGYRY